MTTPAAPAQEVDPLGQAEKNPSISFNNQPVGTSYVGTVVEPATLVQSRDFDTKELAYWPDGNKKMSVVITLDINGSHFGLWAAKPSAMFQALVDAQKEAGQKIAAGGTLGITFVGEVPNEKKPWLNAQKQYKAVYSPPDPFAQQQAPAQQPSNGFGANAGPPPSWATQSPAPAPAAAPVAAPVSAPAAAAPSGPSPEQVAAIKAAGLDPATVFPGYVPA